MSDGATFLPVTSIEQIDALFTASTTEPRLIFLQDPFCPVSNWATREVRALPGEVHVIDVARRTDLSRHLERRSGVQHESPQAIVLRNAKAVWDASHGFITTKRLQTALSAAAASAP